MTDIVERARSRVGTTVPIEELLEAATEIERLRAEIDLTVARAEFYRTHWDAASTALGRLGGHYELSADDAALTEYARLKTLRHD